MSFHWELWEFARGGMTPMEILHAATLAGARGLGYDRDIGSLEVGKLAISSCYGRIRSRTFATPTRFDMSCGVGSCTTATRSTKSGRPRKLTDELVVGTTRSSQAPLMTRSDDHAFPRLSWLAVAILTGEADSIELSIACADTVLQRIWNEGITLRACANSRHVIFDSLDLV